MRLKLWIQFLPEHLQIMTEKPNELSKKISNAGAIFCGEWSPASLGDYLAGPSHVLPTAELRDLRVR